MRKKIVLVPVSVFFFLALLVATGCKKNKSECGCSADTVRTISASDNAIGSIGYSTVDLPGYAAFQNRFVISYNPGPGFDASLVVCNENILPAAIRDLRNDPTKRMDVKFSGNLKPSCYTGISIPEHSDYTIVLTAIEKQ